LGDGTEIYRDAPVAVYGLTDVYALAAGLGFSVALKRDGTVWTWGGSHGPMLGVALTTNSSIPVGVTGLSNVATASAGYSHAVALNADGTVWAWGGNNKGQLGDGSYLSRSSPGKVQRLSDVVSVAAQYDRSAALKADGTVWSWGGRGQVVFASDGSTSYPSDPNPTVLTGLTGIQAIALGRYHTVAL
jgi:alpha-tubulin suppressor-like RCC1 family protein